MTKGERTNLLVHFPNACCIWGAARSWALNAALPSSVQEHCCLSHPHHLPGSVLAGSWSEGPELETGPRPAAGEPGYLHLWAQCLLLPTGSVNSIFHACLCPITHFSWFRERGTWDEGPSPTLKSWSSADLGCIMLKERV